MPQVIRAADLFCGAGGTSTGLVQAANKLGLALDLVAVNHWATAVATHTRNHPWARHVCADLASCDADPSRLVAGGSLDLLAASPECTHHSNARAGKPCSDQSRASAWHVLHWCERLNVRDVLIENVREFEHWGPLNANGRPDKSRRGATFQAFVNALRSMGYTVEWRVLCAADYGGATARHRLFMRASRKPITWPDASHAKKATSDLFGNRLPWRGAREIIDWSIKGVDINARKKPLAPRTLARVAAGLRKFGGAAFMITMEHSGRQPVRSLDEPLPTITTAKGGSFALCEPFVMKYYGSGNGNSPVSAPLPTITTKDRFALIEPTRNGVLFRMFRPHELGAAMGFVNYQFAGTVCEQVKQIGNAVQVDQAEALCASVLQRYAS